MLDFFELHKRFYAPNSEVLETSERSRIHFDQIQESHRHNQIIPIVFFRASSEGTYKQRTACFRSAKIHRLFLQENLGARKEEKLGAYFSSLKLILYQVMSEAPSSRFQADSFKVIRKHSLVREEIS